VASAQSSSTWATVPVVTSPVGMAGAAVSSGAALAVVEAPEALPIRSTATTR
jgi:hypothetical protein